jgi:hypothetical protein
MYSSIAATSSPHICAATELMSNRPSTIVRVVSVSNDNSTRLLCITIVEWTGSLFANYLDRISLNKLNAMKHEYNLPLNSTPSQINSTSEHSWLLSRFNRSEARSEGGGWARSAARSNSNTAKADSYSDRRQWRSCGDQSFTSSRKWRACSRCCFGCNF